MSDKLDSRGEKLKEKFEEKAKEKQEEAALRTTTEAVRTGAAETKSETKKEASKEKPKPVVKKPVVTEATAKTNYLPISPKESVEICRAIRGKLTKKAIAMLERVMELKEAIPYLRHNKEVPHRPGKMAAGRYPIKASKHILGVLKSAVANAKYLNLNEDLLYVKYSKANRAISKEKQGRYANIEITVAESSEKAAAGAKKRGREKTK